MCCASDVLQAHVGATLEPRLETVPDDYGTDDMTETDLNVAAAAAAHTASADTLFFI